MGRAFHVVAAALAMLLGAAAAAPGHSEEMSPAELLDTVVAAGGAPVPADQGLALGYPDATQGALPGFKAAAPSSWYSGASVAPPRLGSSTENRFTLAGGCFRMAPADGEGYLARSGEDYVADTRASESQAFRFQATGLGSYLLLGPDGEFPTADGGGLGATSSPSRRAEWIVRGGEAEGFELVSPRGGELAAGRSTGALDLDPSGDRFELQPAAGCAAFPEIAINATGRPRSSKISYGQTLGTIDPHAHIMAFEAFGRGIHCGRPWHPLGVASALVDCPDHAPNGLGGLAANMYVFQDPTHMHHPDGWPTFRGWPTYEWVFTHEQAYYRWIERSWRGGLRLLTMLAVDNSGVCLTNIHRQTGCNEMDGVRRQIRATKELRDYIDAQAGGPGKGFFRIVRNPFQARRVINRGKLAVVLGIEVSEPLDCGLRNGVPQCNRDDVVARLDEMFRSGVRQMEVVNKFDNAFSGVAMDSGFEGPVANTGNKIVTGEYWEVETCTGPDADKTQVSSVPPAAADLIALMPGGSLQLPAYPPPPHCNSKGLTDLGQFVIRQMAKRGMIFDPDHMSVRARSQALDLVDGLDYSGVVSSHSWADRTSYRRIMELGGVVTPQAPHADEFDDEWRKQRELYAEGKGSRRYGFGFGYGDDMNGFGGPRNPTAGTDAEISYPFASPIDRGVKFDRQQSGTKTYDLNTDGVAHFGQWPDWTEGVRRDGGARLISDLRGGSEAYLRMWERAVGIRGPHRKPRHGHVQADGFNSIRLGMRPNRLLRSAGQPASRTRGWRWRLRRARGAVVGAAFTRRGKVGLVASTARRYRAGGIQPGASARQLRGVAEHLGGKIWVRETGRGSRFVYDLRAGRVRTVGVGTAAVTRSAAKVARFARLAVGGS